jgi:hypothetical protein
LSVVAVAIKTELKCKICRHADRPLIDALLLKRSLRQKDDDGNPVNLRYVLDAMLDLGVENPTEENIKGHWKNHVELRDAEVVDKQTENRKGALDRGDPVDVDAILDKVIRAGESDLDTLYEETGKANVTVDQMLKAAQIKSSRKQDEKVQQLLGGAVAAIGGAFKALAAPKEPKQIESEIVEGEFTEVDG